MNNDSGSLDMERKQLPIRLVAHRGYTTNAVMNSLQAFEAAGKLGFWAIETDVRETSDGVMVCSHDAGVEKLFDGEGAVCDYAWKDLERLKYRSGQEGRIPLFREYLAICSKYQCIPFIETKVNDVEKVIDCAREYFEEDRIILSSINFEHIREARQCSQVFVHHIFTSSECLAELASFGNAGCSFKYDSLENVPDDLAGEIHGMGLKFCLRAGDDPETVFRMRKAGCDYIPTNKVIPQDVAEGAEMT